MNCNPFVDQYGLTVFGLIASIVLSVALIAFTIYGFVQPQGNPRETWTEIVVSRQYEGARSGTAVGVTGSGNVGVGVVSSSAKFYVVTDRDIHTVTKSYWLSVNEGDEIHVGRFTTLFGVSVVAPFTTTDGR